MTSSRPYLIRAIHEWVSENGMTPYLLVNADFEGVNVPREYVENGKIILNIASHACGSLLMGNEFVEFNARFSGRPTNLVVPVSAVLAIYAHENGQGMMFNESDSGGEDGNDTPPDFPPGRGASRSHLKVIK